jgi:hypothetical protein
MCSRTARSIGTVSRLQYATDGRGSKYCHRPAVHFWRRILGLLRFLDRGSRSGLPYPSPARYSERSSVGSVTSSDSISADTTTVCVPRASTRSREPLAPRNLGPDAQILRRVVCQQHRLGGEETRRVLRGLRPRGRCPPLALFIARPSSKLNTRPPSASVYASTAASTPTPVTASSWWKSAPAQLRNPRRSSWG